MDSTPAPTSTARSSRFVCALACAALIAGTLDYTAAIINFVINGGKDPTRIAWYIASALLGRTAAFAGGWATVTLGISLHYVIATGWTILFFLLSSRIPSLGQRPIVAGIGYGFLFGR